MHAVIGPSQIIHCKTQREAWVQIARLSGGCAKPSEGAALMIDVELGKTTRREVASSTSIWITNNYR